MKRLKRFIDYLRRRPRDLLWRFYYVTFAVFEPPSGMRVISEYHRRRVWSPFSYCWMHQHLKSVYPGGTWVIGWSPLRWHEGRFHLDETTKADVDGKNPYMKAQRDGAAETRRREIKANNLKKDPP